jgi:hypothetical protein
MYGIESRAGRYSRFRSFLATFNPSPKKGSFHAYKNLLYPYFFTSGDYSVAVYQGQGTSLQQNLQDILQINASYAENLCAFGVIVDAENNSPQDASQRYAHALRGFFPSNSAIPGMVLSGFPRTGIYVWPDNQRSGTLETLLLECAVLVYPDYVAGALQFRDNLERIHKERWRGSTREKALIASIVSILQPGKANHASFSTLEDQWISQLTLMNVSGLKKLWIFVHDFLDLPW